MEEIRLNKYISMTGEYSRREADRLIEEGRVCVEGSKAVMGMKIDKSSKVTVDGRLLRLPEAKVVIAYNKPIGVTVSQKDEHADVLIYDVLDYPEKLKYAGRLDKDSHGLILMTNDGALINAMMRAKFGHEKEYVVRLSREVTDTAIKELSKGIYLKTLDATTKPCRIIRKSKDTVNIILTEGMNRQIRRMFEVVGYEVVDLKRVRVMNVRLNDLPEGKWRAVEGNELETLYNSVRLSID